MIVGENALGAGIVVDAIRSLADIDLIDQLERVRIEHRDFVLAPIAGESVFEFRSNGRPVNSRRIADCADHFSAVRIYDVDLSAVRDIKPARGAVDVKVVKSSVAGNGILSHDLVA